MASLKDIRTAFANTWPARDLKRWREFNVALYPTGSKAVDEVPDHIRLWVSRPDRPDDEGWVLIPRTRDIVDVTDAAREAVLYAMLDRIQATADGLLDLTSPVGVEGNENAAFDDEVKVLVMHHVAKVWAAARDRTLTASNIADRALKNAAIAAPDTELPKKRTVLRWMTDAER